MACYPPSLLQMLVTIKSCSFPSTHFFDVQRSRARRVLDHCGVESLVDVCVFFLSTHQMNQIRPYICQESAENGLAGVTLSNNSPAPLYIHQSAVSYLGQLYTRVFEGLGVPDTSTPNSSALTPSCKLTFSEVLQCWVTVQVGGFTFEQRWLS